MFMGFFELDTIIDDRANDRNMVACSWGEAAAASVIENEIGSLVAMLPTPVEFSEEELLNHVYLAQKAGLLILETGYLEIVEKKFQVEISNRVKHPTLNWREKAANWLRLVAIKVA